MFETSARGQLKMIWWGRSIPFRLSRQVRCTLDVTCIDDLQVSICFIITYNHIIFTTRKMTNYLCSVEQCGIELKQPWSCPTAEVFAWLHMYWTNRELRLDRDLLLEHIIWEVMSLWISEAHVFGRVANNVFLWRGHACGVIYSMGVCQAVLHSQEHIPLLVPGTWQSTHITSARKRYSWNFVLPVFQFLLLLFIHVIIIIIIFLWKLWLHQSSSQFEGWLHRISSADSAIRGIIDLFLFWFHPCFA